MASNFFNVPGFAYYQACLWTAQKFISRKTYDVDSLQESILDRQLSFQSKSSRVDQRSGTKVVNDRNFVAMSKFGNFGKSRYGCETDDLEIGLMRQQDQIGTFLDGGFIILQVGAIGGTNFDQFCTGKTHHFGNAKTATNLNQLGPGDGDLLTVGEGSQGKHDPSGVVVHHQSCFCPSEAGKQISSMDVPLTALTSVQVVFQG